MHDHREFGTDIEALFGTVHALLARKENLGTALLSDDKELLDVELCTRLGFYIAARDGDGAALEYFDKLHEVLWDTHREDEIGTVFMAQAQLYDRMGKSMSRDLHAVEAAEAFISNGQISAAEKALSLLPAA